jgi:hypothetical protein
VRITTLFLLPMLAMSAMAITPPTPVEPEPGKVFYSWTLATMRGTPPVGPLPLTEVKETRIYITSLSAFIAVPAPATTYTYVVPSGQCVRVSDGSQLTQVDTAGAEGAASPVYQTSKDVCTGKSLPGAPGNVKVTAAP